MAHDLLSEFFRAFRFLSFFREEEDEEFCVHATTHAGVRICVAHADPESMVRASIGRELKKRCRKCGIEKPVTDFSTCVRTPDGRLYRCKTCERIRVREYDARRRKIAAGQKAMPN